MLVDRPRRELRIDSVNWILGVPLPLRAGGEGLELDVRLRHGAALSRGLVRRVEGGADAGQMALTVDKNAGPGLVGGARDGDIDISTATATATATVAASNTAVYSVSLTQRDKGLAPGQFVAFYHGLVCLGAGVISETARDEVER